MKLKKDIVVKQYDNNPEAYFDEVYENSLLSNPAKAEKILKNFKAKQIKKLEKYTKIMRAKKSLFSDRGERLDVSNITVSYKELFALLNPVEFASTVASAIGFCENKGFCGIVQLRCT